MTKRSQEKMDVAVRYGWNSALQEIRWWIDDMQDEEPLSRKEKLILEELESHLDMIHDIWRGNHASS